MCGYLPSRTGIYRRRAATFEAGIGNEEYARQNHSFELTTMRDRHVDISGSTVHFHFRGKSGKQHNVEVDDPRLARIVKRCQDLPGQELFQ